MCTACFTGSYPVALPEDGRIGKHLFEPLPIDLSHSARDVDPAPVLGLGTTPAEAASRRASGIRVDVEGVSYGVDGGAQNALLHP